MMPFIEFQNPIYRNRTQIGGYVGAGVSAGKGRKERGIMKGHEEI